jgi:hypothetical protein
MSLRPALFASHILAAIMSSFEGRRVCNPPYVPQGPDDTGAVPSAGPPLAWNAGADGRLVLDPLCASAPDPTAGRCSWCSRNSQGSSIH